MHRDFRIVFALDNRGAEDLARQELGILLAALVDVDRAELAATPGLPSVTDMLRRREIRFEPEATGPFPPGEEAWQDVRAAMGKRRDGTRAAENATLVAWRVAELRNQGVAADVMLERRALSGALFEYHALVHLPDGQTEDLSRDIGWRPMLQRSRIAFALDLFDGGRERALSEHALNILLRALTAINVAYLRKFPGAPSVYQAGLRYMEEPPGQEDWQDIPTCLAMGTADCEDLAAYRAAERIVRENSPVWPHFVSHKRKDGGMLYHILVGREDPSHRLGMR